MKKIANYTKWLLVLTGVLMIVIGLMLFVSPFDTVWTAASTIGIILLVTAVVDLISFVANFKRFYAGWLFIRSLVTSLVGALLLSQPELSTQLISTAFGLWVIVIGGIQFANSFVARNLGHHEWYWPLIGAVIEVAAGIIVIFNPRIGVEVGAYVIAASLIVDGVVNIIDAFKIQQGLNEVKRWQKALEKLTD